MKKICKKYPLILGIIAVLLFIVINRFIAEIVDVIMQPQKVSKIQYKSKHMVIYYVEGIILLVIILKSNFIKQKNNINWKWNVVLCVCVSLLHTVCIFGATFCYRWKKPLLVKDYIFVIMYAMSVGIVEELVFRGLILNKESLEKYKCSIKGRFMMVIASGICFGISHFLNFFPKRLQIEYYIGWGIGTLIIGALYAVIYMKTNNILLVILLHALYDIPYILSDVQGAFGTKNVELREIVGIVYNIILYIIYPILIISMCIYDKSKKIEYSE